MAILTIFGRVFLWDESKKYIKIIKDNAVKFIIKVINSEKRCTPKFGFEFEFHKIFVDHPNKRVQLDLSGQVDIRNSSTSNLRSPFYLNHEYGGWMIEVIHDLPFQFYNAEGIIDKVNFLYRYLYQKLGEESILSFTSFPMLGIGDHFFKEDLYWIEKESAKTENDKIEEEEEINTSSKEKEKEEKVGEDGIVIKEEDIIRTNPFSQSIFINDIIINRHPRFGNLTRNIRLRRGKKVKILIPIYKDINTNMTIPTESEPYPGNIYMDAMAFGMGNCCIQQTFGADSMTKAAYLYDQFLPLTPILLVLSSSCPIYKGKLSDYDNRFSLIMQGVDDRTDEEKDENSEKYICKSRYSPAYSYISDNKYSYDFYNDYPKFPINEDYYNQLITGGLRPKLAKHFANLLCRDPLVIFEKKIEIKDENDMTHFENINSTNWNSLRFKLPRPADNDTCFKVEVRSCDLQITPYENIAMFSFMLGLYGVIMNYDVNFILPISMVDENFERAFKRNAINEGKFWWRINSIKKIELDDTDKSTEYTEAQRPPLTLEEDIRDNIRELTLNEIINGCERYNYPGLIKIILDAINKLYKADKLNEYIIFLSKRASGQLWTDAKLIREFIMNHPKYKHDSTIDEEINYDLICYILKIQKGEIKPKETLGEM